MANDLQSWFRALPYKLQRELAGELKDIADGLADKIRSEAPTGPTGKLKDSVRVRRGRKTLELYVEAGGDLTTKEVRAGSGVAYDYALAQEFGTQRMPAQPFFYSTYRAEQAGIRERIEDAVSDVIAKA